MTTTNKFAIGICVLLALAVLPFLITMEGDAVTRTIAVLGFALTMGKAAYDIYDKERERKKKAEEGRERIKAIMKYGLWDSSGLDLGVVIYNEGTSPVHIESVICHFGSEQAEFSTTYHHQRTKLIGPKDKANFTFKSLGNNVSNRISELPKETVWLVISSYQGEICRVEGEEILKVLNSPHTNQTTS